jgi:hypothetical protein
LYAVSLDPGLSKFIPLPVCADVRYGWIILFGSLSGVLFCQLRGIFGDHVLYAFQSQRTERQFHLRRELAIHRHGWVRLVSAHI